MASLRAASSPGLPPDQEEKEALRSVSPFTSHSCRGSRSSSPGISNVHGTTRSSYASSLPPRPRSSPPSLDMTVRHVLSSGSGHEYARSKSEPTPPEDAAFGHLEVDYHRAATLPRQPVSCMDEPKDELPRDHDSQQTAAMTLPPKNDQELPIFVPLPELARLLRLQRYQNRRCQQLQSQLHKIQIATARSARLASIGRSVQRTLAECIRFEDKPSFVSLFNAYQDALDGVRLASSTSGEDSSTLFGEPLQGQDSVLKRLSAPSRTAVSEFLTNLRYDGNFIADRLASLDYKELLALTPERSVARPAESVFGFSSATYSRASRHLGFVVDGQTELLTSLAFASPLETLMSTVQGCAGPSGFEGERCLDVWSTVCARLIAEQRPGSERLVPAVLDIWSSSNAWPGKSRLELWILETLQAGSFLLEQSSKQSFRMRMQARPDSSAEEDIRAQAFYIQAANDLLDLLADSQGASVIPESVLRMVQAIWNKLQPFPGHRRALPHFLVTRWLFTPFLHEAITLPETHGMAAEHYISDNARYRILREVANRAQKYIFDVAYSWKHGHFVPPETIARIEAIMLRFHGDEIDCQSTLRPMPETETCVVLPVSDLLSLSKALFPSRRSASTPFDQDTLRSDPQSSASSTSGFSLFQNAGAGHPWFGLLVPSVPGTSGPASASSLDPDASSSTPVRVTNQEGACWPSEYTEALWDACGSLEDLLSASFNSPDHWLLLTTVPGEPRLQWFQGDSPPNPGITTNMDECRLEPSAAMECTSIAEELLSGVEELEAFYEFEPRSTEPTTSTDVSEHLLRAIERRRIAAEHVSDYIGAHHWFSNHDRLQNICADRPGLTSLRFALRHIEQRAHRCLTYDELAVDSSDRWIQVIKPAREAWLGTLFERERVIGLLRDKMWFVADVRTSAAYDEARSVIGALRIMGRHKRHPATRMIPPLRHWSASKASSTSLHLKTEAQILEVLSAVPEHGGPNKLSDDQARSTALYMEQHNVENLCRGEERIHRLCMEIRKCVEQLTSAGHATLSANPLFGRERIGAESYKHGTPASSLAAVNSAAGQLSELTLQTNVAPSIVSVSSASQPLSSASSRDYLESRSPALTHKSSAPFWSPALTEDQSPSSATSLGSYHTYAASGSPRAKRNSASVGYGQADLEHLRQYLTSFLLSDLASPVFADGSETDRAFWTGLGGELTTIQLQRLYGSDPQRDDRNSGMTTSFDYDAACKQLLRSFSTCCSVRGKLELLHSLNRLLSLSVANQGYSRRLGVGAQTNQEADLSKRSVPGLSSNADRNVEAFCMLFANSETRPRAIVRDLQYIAALIPSSVLESTPSGKSFWNAAIAIARIKQQARTLMVETADSIIGHHSNNRGHGQSPSAVQQRRDNATFSMPSRSSSAEQVGSYRMEDAAYLLQITAKEGDVVAQRELATLYLTHPELMDRIIAPFARPKDVFKEELERKWKRNQDPNRCDPTTMCVAHHWMSLSSKGGDALAKEYLRQREEMERLP